MSTTDIGTQDDFVDELLGDFLAESSDLLGHLNENLLQLDEWVQSLTDDQPSRCDDDLLNEMFRAAHSLKGLSAMLGFNQVMELTHKVENIFDAARNDQLSVTSDVVELIFQSIDRLEAMIDCIKNRTTGDVDCVTLLEHIHQLLEDAGADREQASQNDAEQALDALTNDEVVESPSSDSTCQQEPSSATGAAKADGCPSCVSTSSSRPAESASQESRKPASFSVRGQAVPSPATESEPSSDVTSRGTARRPSTDGDKQPSETLRVDVERLDELMNLAGQLVINKARFAQISDEMKSVTTSHRGSHSLENVFASLNRLVHDVDRRDGEHNLADAMESIRRCVHSMQTDLEVVGRELEGCTRVRSSVGDLTEAVHQLDRTTSGIQKTVMDTRMVPIGPLFRRFRRVIRDISRTSGKEIELVIRGEKTELDKRMIDALGDPLVHMIRNSADHGVGRPDERLAAGKPRRGTVTLDAFHRGNSILIQVCDDGRGLDAKMIRAKAIQKEIVSAADAEKLSDPELYQLIWAPGFSTVERVTNVSGRGMGMDIVRSKIEALKGTVELESRLGQGTTVTIKLPLTMAILPSLLVEIEGDIFAIPVESVV